MKVERKADHAVSDDSCKAATGKSLNEWFALMDARGGIALGRRELGQYLFAEMNLRVKPKLFRELAEGARVVSHDFDMGKGWPPDKQYDFGTDAIYLWIMPPRSQRGA